MRFTRQDLITFGLGALVAAAVVLGEALIKLEEEPITNISRWAVVVGVAIGTALLRYLTTRLPEFLARE